jgi:hypothetical protein
LDIVAKLAKEKVTLREGRLFLLHRAYLKRIVILLEFNAMSIEEPILAENGRDAGRINESCDQWAYPLNADNFYADPVKPGR